MTSKYFCRRSNAVALTISMLSFCLSGCTILPGGGPTTRAVNEAAGKPAGSGHVAVVDVDDAVTARLAATNVSASFAEVLGDAQAYGTIVGPGDGLNVTIWEAPPAVLFGGMLPTAGGDSTSNASNLRPSDLPQQTVGSDGRIEVPFAGAIQAAGRTPEQIGQAIRARLLGKAHDPQVIVRVIHNATSNVTIVGEVANSIRMPLTAKGERLLDALASAGGVRQPVGKMTVQVTRGQVVEKMPLEAVIKDPRQNVHLQADDVVTLLFQPYSFTVLGAAKSNQEIPFEGTGLTLSQALGRMGGLDDQRATPKGVFIFRFEDPSLFAKNSEPMPPITKDGRIPVIYRVNMRDPTTLFVAQSFPIKDKDVIYISNAPLADFSKFLQAVSQIVYPIAVIQTTNIF